MSTAQPLPGSPQQQAILQMIAEQYADDPRVLAVLLFGSLGRGAGDVYSDLDLSVVVRDDCAVEVGHEIERVRAALDACGDPALMVQVAGNDGYVISQSLVGISLDYQPLASLPAYILEGWRTLVGSLDAETVRAAAASNVSHRLAPDMQLHRALWLALGADIALQRRQFWGALPWLDPMRGALLDIFAVSLRVASRPRQKYSSARTHQCFEAEASAELQAKFGRTFPQFFPDSPSGSLFSSGDALIALLDILEYDLAELSNDQVQLGAGEREFIARLRARQAALRSQAWRE